MDLIRCDVSSSLGACLANTFLLDLKDMNFLNPSILLKDIIQDRSKIDREKARVKVTSQQKHVAETMTNLICIGVDYRVDKDTFAVQDYKRKW